MTTSPGTSIHTQARLTGGLPVRFARRSAPAPGEPVPSPASTSTARKTARTRLNVDDARCEALFASALAIGRTGRRKRGRSDQPRRAPVRYPRLRLPDGTRVRRPPRGGRRADALGPPARRRGGCPGDLRARARGRLAGPRGSPPARP